LPDEFETKPFRCSTEQRGQTVHVHPHGDLDMRTVPELDEQLCAVKAAGAKQVVVDLRGLSFMDSTGLSLLTRWNLEARRDGFNFALIQGSHRVQRLFELTALGEYFTFVSG
jgi:anti-sigma B factor antagonist